MLNELYFATTTIDDNSWWTTFMTKIRVSMFRQTNTSKNCVETLRVKYLNAHNFHFVFLLFKT